jgi:hypothetical protein
MDSKMEHKMNDYIISEMNGNYWDEILNQSFYAGVGMSDNATFYDFVYMYCGA